MFVIASRHTSVKRRLFTRHKELQEVCADRKTSRQNQSSKVHRCDESRTASVGYRRTLVRPTDAYKVSPHDGGAVTALQPDGVHAGMSSQ